MPQEPKKRHSRQRQGKRRASISLPLPGFIRCDNCQSPILSHVVCKNCGYYKGRDVRKSNNTAEVKVNNENPA